MNRQKLFENLQIESKRRNEGDCKRICALPVSGNKCSMLIHNRSQIVGFENLELLSCSELILKTSSFYEHKSKLESR